MILDSVRRLREIPYNYTSFSDREIVIRYLGEGVLDYVLVNNTKPPAKILKRYEERNSPLAKLDPGLDQLDVNVVRADLIERIDTTRLLWEKADLLRHDPDKLANEIMKLANEE